VRFLSFKYILGTYGGTGTPIFVYSPNYYIMSIVSSALQEGYHNKLQLDFFYRLMLRFYYYYIILSPFHDKPPRFKPVRLHQIKIKTTNQYKIPIALCTLLFSIASFLIPMHLMTNAANVKLGLKAIYIAIALEEGLT